MLWPQSTDDLRSEQNFSFRSEIVAVGIALIATFVAVVFVFQLWGLNPRVPILYSGDGLLTLNGLRNMRFGSWYWSTDKLGAPFGQDLHDFPAVADNFHVIILWIGVKLLRDEVLTFNLYFFGSYLLTTIGGYIGARMLRIDRRASVLIGVLYSFVPYHFLQGPGHLYLAAYWAIPFWVSFLVRELMNDSISISLPTSLLPLPLLKWCRSRESIFIVLISITAASTGLYYAFFFLILGTIVLCIRRLSQSADFQWAPISLAMCVALFTMALQFLPIWLYQRNNGNNLSIVERTVAAVEFYSLKLSNMVLPIAGHRLSLFADLRNRSNPAYLIGEGSEALGLLGSIGLIALICLAIYRLSRPKPGIFTALASFTVIAILVCTVGGLAQVIAVFGFTQLRVWSRMSIVIAFPAIVFAFLLINKFLHKMGKPISTLAMIVIASLSILDTNPGHQLPSYKETARAWEIDRDLVKQIENRVGSDALVFQLPIVPFPENPPVVNMSDYAHLRGYLHSKTLRWSYGGVKGRIAETQLEPSEDAASFLSQLTVKGFDVLWIDRRGYTDQGESLVSIFTKSGLNISFTDDNTYVLMLK